MVCKTICGVAVFFYASLLAAQTAVSPIIEGYSAEVAEALVKRQLAEAAARERASNVVLDSLFSQDYLWKNGNVVTVAFMGGSYPVWKEISRLANVWTKYANVTFDFGLNPTKKTARTWKLGDPASIAHIRIRLDENIFVRSSAIGSDSFSSIHSDGSMMLAGIANSYPRWTDEDQADIIHEFGHALGLFHEQQRAECINDFRMIVGSNGEPSVYDVYWTTYKWKRQKVQDNLTLDARIRVGGSSKPDVESIMLYPLLDALLPATLHGKDGPCYVGKKNTAVSKGDIEAIRALYPGKAVSGVVLAVLPIPDPRRNIPVFQALIESADERDKAIISERIAILDKATRPLVWIQFGDEPSRAIATSIQKLARNQGYVAPGIEKVTSTKVPRKLEVRYFRKSDEDSAGNVAKIVGDEAMLPVSQRYIKKYESTTKPGTIEVWLPLRK